MRKAINFVLDLLDFVNVYTIEDFMLDADLLNKNREDTFDAYLEFIFEYVKRNLEDLIKDYEYWNRDDEFKEELLTMLKNENKLMNLIKRELSELREEFLSR